MEIGFETIGNATLIAHDRTPVLVTDPWIAGGAYFGSWNLSHEIPLEQLHAINNSHYVWISHGHPDHLSGESLQLLKDKTLLLPDHVGGRIATGLQHDGFNILILKDRVWTRISPRIQILCIADYNQDAILLLDIDETLVVNLNDASDHGWRSVVKTTIRNFKHTFLLKLFGYGDADMINFFDENDRRIEPQAGAKFPPVGSTITNAAEEFGVNHVVPFSSMHRYQREDSVWANQYTTPLDAYRIGFTSKRCELLPAFIQYNCQKQQFIEINPKVNPERALSPSMFGDDWSEPLDTDEFRKIDDYFNSISHIQEICDFLNFRVGGKDHRLEFKRRSFKKGIIFEVPRNSLMQAIQFEIFDDLLIGNFMKTKLEGKWPHTGLYPDFTPYVSKYADNGRAKSPDELRTYFRAYMKRAPLDYLRHRIQHRVRERVRSHIKANTRLHQFARATWWLTQRWI